MKWRWYKEKCDEHDYIVYLPAPKNSCDAGYWGEVSIDYGWDKKGEYKEHWDAHICMTHKGFICGGDFETEQEAKNYVEKNLQTKVKEYANSEIAKWEKIRDSVE